MDQSQQFHNPLQRMPTMNSIGSSYPGNIHPIHPPLLQSPARHHDPSYSHHPRMRRELSLDIRATGNPLLESFTPKISTKAGTWNQINMQDSFTNVQSPNQRFIRHQPNLTLSISNGRPQYMDMRPQLSLRAAPEQSQSPYTFGYGIEAQMEKQNRMLSQLMGQIAKQELAEKHRIQMDMNQKMKELEIDRLKVEIELEKQRAKRQQTIEEMTKKTENNVSPKKEASSLEKVVMSLLIKKSSSQGRNAQLNERIGSLPLISERQYGEHDEFIEDQDEEEVVRPQKSPRKRVVISRSSLLRKEPTNTAIIKLQSQPMKSSDPTEISGSLDYLNDLSPSQKSPTKKKSLKKNLDESTPMSAMSRSEGRFSRVASLVENEGSTSPKKRKSKNDRTTKKSDDKGSPIMVINEEELDDAMIETSPQNEKKKKAQSKLRNVAWLLVYPRILYAARKKHMMDDRETFEMAVSSSMGQIYEMSKIFIQDCAGKEILKMLTDSSFSYSLANLSASQAKKSEKMCAGLVTHLKQIFNKLIVNIGNIPSVLLHLLAPLIQEEGFLQNDYFSQFEINRMKFGPFGNLK